MILPLGAVVREEPLDDVDEEEAEDPAELLEDVEDEAEPETLALVPELVLEASSLEEAETELDDASELDEDELDP